MSASCCMVAHMSSSPSSMMAFMMRPADLTMAMEGCCTNRPQHAMHPRQRTSQNNDRRRSDLKEPVHDAAEVGEHLENHVELLAIGCFAVPRTWHARHELAA